MRVTSNTFPSTLSSQLNLIANRQNKLQSQAATGQRIENASDDPVGMRRVLDLQAESKSIGQYERNIARHRELAGATFAGMKGLKGVLDRATEIATKAVAVNSPQELTIYAGEITELVKQAVQLVNAKNRGDYVFAGTKSDTQPFEMTLDPNGVVTGVSYAGNDAVSESEVAEGVTLSAQVAGANTSGVGSRGLVTDTRHGADLFRHLIQLRDQLISGNTTDIAKVSRPALASDEENLLFHMGTNGAIQSRIDATEAVLKNRGESLEELISKDADADLAQTMVKLSQTQTAYQAALQSGGTILGKSLLDFLR